MRWMNLEPITQSEVCQKEKDKYYVLTYVWNLDDTDAFICKAAMEKQTQRTDLQTQCGEEGEGEIYGESNMETYITTCEIDSHWECAV